MTSSPIRHYDSGHCEFPADLENVAAVSSLLKSFCQRHCLDETLWPQIDLAVCECLNNAIEHGCDEDPSKTIRAAWRWQDEELVVEIEDPGAFVPLQKNPGLPDDPLQESGRGSFIIDAIAKSCTRAKTPYGQAVTMRIATHQPTDILGQMEEMYAMLQAFSNDLNTAYAERDVIAGFASDMATSPAIEGIIKQGVERLHGLIDLVQVDVWNLTAEDTLENAYHEGPEPLAIKEAIVSPDNACACFTVIATQTEHFIEDCSILRLDDPLYRDSGVSMACPIVYQDDCLGVVALHCRDSDRDLLFEKLLPLVRVFSQFLGLAYTSAKAYRQREEHERARSQLEVASEIQRSLLPSSYPSNRHCRVTGRCVAAMAVGGDYIDAIEIRDVGLLVVIADVMGKGVPAALLATIFRTAIRSRLNLAETPGWLLSKINKQIHEELGHLNMFITAQAAFLTYEKRMLKLASAGHCPALVLHPGSLSAETFEAEGMPLGIDPNDLYEEKIIKLEEGARVLFLTDGIYEAESPSGAMLGLETIANALHGFWRDGFDAVPQRAFDFVDAFTIDRPPQDDRTLLALEIL